MYFIQHWALTVQHLQNSLALSLTPVFYWPF